MARKRTITKKKDRPEQVIERENRVWEMRVNEFASEGTIARDLGITQSAVSQILKRVVRRHQVQLGVSVVEVQTQQIRMLTRIAEEAWNAWIASKSKRGTLSKKTYVDQTPTPQLPAADKEKPSKALLRYGGRKFEETVFRTQEEHGQPAYLAVCIRALADIRSITGADAPRRLTVDDARTMLSELTGTPVDEIPMGPEESMPETTYDQPLG